MRKSFLLKIAIVSAVFGFSASCVLAKTDLSILASDISFSREEALEGEKIKIFARTFNLGDTDVYGFVVFSDSGKEIASPQPISVRAGAYDDAFVDWEASASIHDIQVKITNTSLPDEDSANNQALRENYFVDSDTDGDSVGNSKDPDDDNDGLADDKEIALGTDSLKSDTDGDKAKDNIDPFPLDIKEWQDFDRDQIGDNADLDDDNDGRTDEEEIFSLGTNPLSPDSSIERVSGAISEKIQNFAKERDWLHLAKKFYWLPLVLILFLYLLRKLKRR